MRQHRRHVVPGALVLLGLIPSACGSDGDVETFEVTGEVTELVSATETGPPIEGARVRFTSDTLLRAETETDSNGFYRMNVQSDIDFGQIRADAEGFVSGEATVFFDTPRRVVNLSLRVDLDADE